jgi:hypothetical protein
MPILDPADLNIFYFAILLGFAVSILKSVWRHK